MGQELINIDSTTTLIVNSPTNTREQYILSEHNRQQYAMACESLRAQLSESLTSERRKHIMFLAKDLSDYVEGLMPEIAKLSPVYRKLMEDFCYKQVILFMKDITDIEQTAANNIARLVSISLLIEPPPPPPPEPKMITTYYSPPPPRRGILAWLFGG